MIWLVALLPALAAPALWFFGRTASRATLGAVGCSVLAATTALAGWAAFARPTGAYRWGAGLTLHVGVGDAAATMAVLVPAVGLVVVAYAAHHEDRAGLGRLVATLVGFVGMMELLVLAEDLLVLLVAWELVGACSWALISHEWRDGERPQAAAHAFLVTRFGDLGLFAAIGATRAGTGSFRYQDLSELHGGWLHVFVAGIVLAALAKSAQFPFSPWLFSAMAGPTSVSALLHAATMVAAGAYLLIRLHPVLDLAGWFAPVIIAVGLVTALAGGVVAVLQAHAKKLLAASTSAQYGLMLVALGAGYPAVALAHLVAHAAFKAGLFLSAGVAIEATGSEQLGRMGLGRLLRATAAVTGVLALALAAVPPLGAAFTKEAIASAAGHHAAWLAVGVAVAGALSAAYAARYWLLAYGPPATEAPRSLVRRPGPVEVGAITVTAAASAGLGVLWVPGVREVVGRLAGGTIVEGAPWEAALSLSLVAVALYASWAAFRSGTLLGDVTSGRRAALADWFAVPALAKVAIVDPTLHLAAGLARFDDAVLDAPPRAVSQLVVGRGGAGERTGLAPALARFDHRVVDAGVRATGAFARWCARIGTTVAERGVDGGVRDLASLIGRSGRDVRRLHTGRAHQYYVIVAVGLVALVIVAGVIT